MAMPKTKDEIVFEIACATDEKLPTRINSIFQREQKKNPWTKTSVIYWTSEMIFGKAFFFHATNAHAVGVSLQRIVNEIKKCIFTNNKIS